MNLNPKTPNNAEDRKEKRQLLEAAAIETIRSFLRLEISDIAPAGWTPEMLDDLIEQKIAESQRIIDGLSLTELEDDFNMQRHGEWVVAMAEAEMHMRTAEALLEVASSRGLKI